MTSNIQDLASLTLETFIYHNAVDICGFCWPIYTQTFFCHITPSPTLCLWVLGWSHFSTSHESRKITALSSCGCRFRDRRGLVTLRHTAERQTHIFLLGWSYLIVDCISSSWPLYCHQWGYGGWSHLEQSRAKNRERLGLVALCKPLLKLDLPLHVSVLWANEFPCCLRYLGATCSVTCNRKLAYRNRPRVSFEEQWRESWFTDKFLTV